MQQLSCLLIFLMYCWLGSSTVWACNTSEHHSVLNHYNHAQKVFEGKVVRLGKLHQKKFSFEDKETGLRSIFITFKVLKGYKNALVEEEITVGVLPGLYADFEKKKSYLIYANAKVGYDFLICEKGFCLTDKEAMKAHQLLFQIPYQHTGYWVEYSTFGQKWAEGKLEMGLPVGEWKYYSKSGELQIKGCYQEGEEVGTWEYYYHTNDDSYVILHQIITGAYYQKTGSYQVLSLDSNLTGMFRHQVQYLVGEDTLSEYFYYNQRSLSKKVVYQKGWRNGKEERFDEQGDCISMYHFVEGRLEGDFWEWQKLRGQQKRYLKVEGYYKADKKMDERHLYYENKVLLKSREILKNGKLI